MPLKSQCLPFSQIPHTTRLFSDYLFDFSKVQQFYSRSPHFSNWVKDEAPKILREASRHAQVADVLERQNRHWGASAKTLENIGRLRAGAAAVVTGQQVGLFGGPLFGILKALTAVKLADQARSAEVDAVPVFWLATTDHDLVEVNHVTVPGPEGSLQKLTTSTRGVTDAPVGTIFFGAEIEPLVDEAAALLGDSEAAAFLRESYRQRETLGSGFARLYARLFAEWGVILLDAADPELNAIAAPMYRAAIARAAELNEALLSRGKAIDAAGYHQQVKVTPSSTLVFAIEDGARTPIHRRTASGASEEEFSIGERKLSQSDLLASVASHPENFNANVLLRPIIQDFLLPTLAYCGGAAEIAYFAQVQVVYEALLGRSTPIVPRFSATIVEAKPQAVLEKFGIGLPDLFSGAERLREILAEKTLPQSVQTAFDHAGQTLERALLEIRQALEHVDKTLVDAAGNAEAKMHHQLDSLRAKAARAELRHSEVLTRKAESLSNALYPGKALQEREIAAIYFVSRYGQQLLRDLYEFIHTDCLDHQVISL